MQLIRLGSTLVLAALLAPGDFGLMAMVWVITGIVEMFVDLGTGQALIQRRELTPRLCGSVFWANVAFGAALTSLVAWRASDVATLFAEPQVVDLIVSIAPVFVLAAIGVVPGALLQREMRFDLTARARLVGALAAGGTGIGFAVHGAGVWSMVWGHYAGAAVTSGALIFSARFRPQFTFSLVDLRSVAGFSGNLLATNLSNFLVGQVDTIVIGRMFGRDVLGCYSLAKKVVLQPVVAAGSSVVNVLFARFARMADDDASSIGPRFVSASAALVALLAPIAIGMAMVAEPLLAALSGGQRGQASNGWTLVAPLIALLAPAAVAGAVSLPTGAVFRAVARTDLLLRVGLLRGVVLVASVCLGAVTAGVGGAAFGLSIGMFASLLPGLIAALRLIDVPTRKFVMALRPVVVGVSVLVLVTTSVRVAAQAAGVGALPVAVGIVLSGVAGYTLSLVLQRPPFVAELLARGGTGSASPGGTEAIA